MPRARRDTVLSWLISACAHAGLLVLGTLAAISGQSGAGDEVADATISLRLTPSAGSTGGDGGHALLWPLEVDDRAPIAVRDERPEIVPLSEPAPIDLAQAARDALDLETTVTSAPPRRVGVGASEPRLSAGAFATDAVPRARAARGAAGEDRGVRRSAAPAAPGTATGPEASASGAGGGAASAAGDAVAAPVSRFTPEPEYPSASIRLGEQGRVRCALAIDAAGNVVAVEVETTSGHPRLDRAAREALARWRFDPARRAGIAIATRIVHVVVFRLE